MFFMFQNKVNGPKIKINDFIFVSFGMFFPHFQKTGISPDM